MTSNPTSFFENERASVIHKTINRKCAGVSPLVSTIIIIAITVVMGLALFAYTNSQANVATQAFSEEATDFINYRNDRFVVANMGFKESGKCATAAADFCFTAYVFNSGNLPVQISTISAGKDDGSLQPYCVDTLTENVIIEPKTMAAVPFYGPAFIDPGDGTVSCPPAVPQLVTDGVYSIRVASQTGSYQMYFQKFTEAV